MMNIGIYIYDEAEVLDFSGPFEVFSTAVRLADDPDPFDVFLVSEHGSTVTARAGYQVIPRFGFSDHPQIDLLVVAGGMHQDELKKPQVLRWIKAQADKAQLVASVCTGAFLLAEAGVLTQQKVTTHWATIKNMREDYPSLEVLENQRWVDEGDIITSAGISAGIDMSLHLVSKLQSMELAIKTARLMEYDWQSNLKMNMQ